MSANLTPEERARVLIDEQLTQAGWVVQDRKEIDLVNHVGVAVRETILKNVAGRADYLLYLNRKIVGVTSQTTPFLEFLNLPGSPRLSTGAKSLAFLIF